MQFTALLHILAMANLVGLMVPFVMLNRASRTSDDVNVRVQVARLYTQLILFAYLMLLVVVATGIGRVAESDYPWFAFGTMFWLAAKQTIGLLSALFILATWVHVRRVLKVLRSKASTDIPVSDKLQSFGRVRGWAQMVVGLGWVLLVLAILKF